MHISEQIPMKRAFMRPVATCAELLKVIEATFRRRHAVMAETASFFVKMTTTDLVAIFLPWKLKLQSSARLEGRASSSWRPSIWRNLPSTAPRASPLRERQLSR